MLEAAKENRDMTAGHALRGVGAETPATGIPADKQAAAHRRAHTGTHTGSIRDQGKSGVFFHTMCQLAALEVLCIHQLKGHRESSSCRVKEEHDSLSTSRKQRLKALLSIDTSKCTVISYSTFSSKAHSLHLLISSFGMKGANFIVLPCLGTDSISGNTGNSSRPDVCPPSWSGFPHRAICVSLRARKQVCA